jgi:hypothetical protein
MYNGYANQDEFHKALAQGMQEYADVMDKAVANGTYATGWTHANCDHAYGYCEVA